MSNFAKDPYSQDKIEEFKPRVGSSTWSFLHSMASSYPSNPTERQKRLMSSFIDGLGEFYPCSTCAEDFRENIIASPPKLGNNKELSVWFCDQHNLVNKKLGKPIFNCDRVWEKWSSGHDDGNPGCKVCPEVLGKDKIKMMEDLLRKK
jgi:FAD-linked sulfhydryl oxidase